jgi:hypothetical protein
LEKDERFSKLNEMLGVIVEKPIVTASRMVCQGGKLSYGKAFSDFFPSVGVRFGLRDIVNGIPSIVLE